MKHKLHHICTALQFETKIEKVYIKRNHLSMRKAERMANVRVFLHTVQSTRSNDLNVKTRQCFSLTEKESFQ